MRYVTTLVLATPPRDANRVEEVLRRQGVDTVWEPVLRIPFEKDDGRRQELEKELHALGYRAFTLSEPAFEDWEVDEAELLILRIQEFCGEGFEHWAGKGNLPVGTRAIDKREMGWRDIAMTFRLGQEVIVSERFKEILEVEGLDGWTADQVVHYQPNRDSRPPVYQFIATASLPPVASETDLDVDVRKVSGDPFYGGESLSQSGPLIYDRSSLLSYRDFNKTHELFGDVAVASPLIIISQRARRVLTSHKIRGKLEFEPIIIKNGAVAGNIQ